jgi:hypothetical protein
MRKRRGEDGGRAGRAQWRCCLVGCVTVRDCAFRRLNLKTVHSMYCLYIKTIVKQQNVWQHRGGSLTYGSDDARGKLCQKDKNGTFSAGQTISPARLDLATAQRSAAAQQTAGGAARVDLCVPVRCSASARAATAMALSAVASSSCSSASNAAVRPSPTRLSDPKAAAAR